MFEGAVDSVKPTAASDSNEKPLGAIQAEALIGQLAAAFLRQSAAVRTESEGEPNLPIYHPPNPEQPIYRALVEQIPAVIFVAYLDRGVSEAYVSPQIEASLGFSQEEWLDDPIRWYQQVTR